MASRLDLQEKFEEILGNGNVYYDPPTSKYIKYPCVVYKLNKHDATYANGKKYIRKTSYDVLLIDPDTESIYCKPIEDLEYCRHDRTYVSDGLCHYAYTIYI